MKNCTPIAQQDQLPDGCRPPVIVVQPIASTLTEGGTATFTVVASGSGLSYQWYKNNVELKGFNTATIKLLNTDSTFNGNYTARVWNRCGVVLTLPALLTINQGICVPPIVLLQPIGGTFNSGASKTFYATATGTHLVYQWYKNNVAIGGATGTSYTIPSLQSSDAANYRLIVTNICGTASSSIATIIINMPPVAIPGSNQSLTLPTSTGVLNGSASYDPDGTIVSYLWAKVSGPATYAIANPAAASTTVTGLVAGTYVFSLTVTDNLGLTNTASITITVAVATIQFTIGWSATDPFVDNFTALNITNAQTITYGPGGNLVFSGALANFANKYVMWKYPSTEPIMTIWSNGDPATALNKGVIPDYSLRDVFTIGAFHYVCCRNPLALDTSLDLRLIHP